MTNDDIILSWGKENLYQWTAEKLAATRISRESARFLGDVGLPINQNWTLEFNLDKTNLPKHKLTDNFVIIGYDDIVPLCIDLNYSDCVKAIQSVVALPNQFANSSVRLFGECLVVFQHYRVAVQKMTDDDALTLVKSVERQFMNIDAESVGSKNTFWSTTLEQMKSGNL